MRQTATRRQPHDGRTATVPGPGDSISRLASIVVSVIFLSASGSSALADNKRTWISGSGVDQSGCGAITNPCRSLQFAHDNTNYGGEIDVKDSAAYGNLVITKTMRIVNDGNLASVTAASGGNAIEIREGAADVTLRGLTVNGFGSTGNGIVFNASGNLTIDHCTIYNFAGNGILLTPPESYSALITLTNLTISANGLSAILLTNRPNSGLPSGKVVVANVMMDSNGTGLFLNGADSASFNISHSHATNHPLIGISVDGPSSMMLSDVMATNNQVGINFGSGTGSLNRSIVTSNRRGVFASASCNCSSYGNNQISMNSADDVVGTFQIATPK